MPAAFKARLAQLWTKLAQHHKWELIKDQAVFFDQVTNRVLIAYLSKTSLSDIPDKQLRSALIGIYNEHLYHCLQKQDEQAAHELWQACFRLSQKNHLPQEEAHDAAQETVLRVLRNLSNIQQPCYTFHYAFTTLSRFIQEQKHKSEKQGISLREGSAPKADLESSSNEIYEDQVNGAIYFPEFIEIVIQKETRTKAISFFKQVLRKPLELEVMLLILEGYTPREIAEKLKLTSQRVRIAKHRAIKKLKKDREFMAFMGSLS